MLRNTSRNMLRAQEDGSVVTWGDAGAGGVVDDHVQHSVRNLDTVTCNLRAFAAITRGVSSLETVHDVKCMRIMRERLDEYIKNNILNIC